MQLKNLLINKFIKFITANNPEGVLACLIFGLGSKKSFVSEKECKQLSLEHQRKQNIPLTFGSGL